MTASEMIKNDLINTLPPCLIAASSAHRVVRDRVSLLETKLTFSLPILKGSSIYPKT